MGLERRTVIKLLAGAAVSTGMSGMLRTRASANLLALRSVIPADAVFVRTIINLCVRDDGAFHGRCGDWSAAWASEFVVRAPQSVVLTLAGLPVAFQEVPTIRPAYDPPAPDAPLATWARYERRRANRLRCHLTAAGVRTDVLLAAESVLMFRRVLYYGFRAARRQGFETGEGCFPWEQHPHMPRRWTDYPGCELVEPPSVSAVDGRRIYRLRWQLDAVIAALAAEGAGAEALDVP